ncbi:MAG TPA: DUF3014 domain-containing protein [Anaeromyxobacteraceae bacterium]|nr:DUF3014 domain-containing protein [Anaeromyxobacteraceae bacterium]
MEQPKSTLQRPSRAPWVILVLLLAIAAALAVRWWLRSQQAPPPAAPVAVEAPPPDAGTGADAGAPAGPAAAADQRSVVEAISPNALFRRWAAEGDLVRRWVVVTDNLAVGVSPRGQLASLAPARPFSVQERGGQTVIAPAAYHRYDDFGDVVASIDAAAGARCYRGLHGALEAAYRALGYPGADLDAVTARALRRLVEAPVREGDVAVRKEERVYVFADDRLEELGAVEKHLLRMGPRNARIVQAKARELLAALGLEAAGAPR